MKKMILISLVVMLAFTGCGDDGDDGGSNYLLLPGLSISYPSESDITAVWAIPDHENIDGAATVARANATCRAADRGEAVQ